MAGFRDGSVDGWSAELAGEGLDHLGLEPVLEEYAQHTGHADLIRERIDGTTGA
ncbi:DUF664 domain-containing protein [Actinopolymorpha sp. B17G11]|uniref:mycothiol transferase n=1 Tax=unclassified Actinopolymorpha TaxID=2627063 RepID=UPI0032D953C6